MNSFRTRISTHNFDEIKSRAMTPSEMIAFLEDGALYRTFPDVLTEVYPHADLAPRLSRGLAKLSGSELSGIQRKVRNWMNGSNTPQNREQLFEIAFVLGLSEGAANRLLASASDCGIHYRNPQELVYAYALRTGLSWADAQALLARMKPLYEDGMRDGQAARAALMASGDTTGSPVIYTRQLRDDFAHVDTEDDLRSFFTLYATQFGEIHETAYEKFMELLGYLQDPEGGEGYQSIGHIVDEYMRMNVPDTKRVAKLSYLQKVIKKNWPTETMITRMKNRTIDVSRKVLLLLFLITEDFEYNPAYADDDDESNRDIYYEDLIEDDPEERLEIRLNQINLFLEHYGMNLLDPGNPFDCLVLYALRAEYDEQDSMSENVKNAIEVLFKDM